MKKLIALLLALVCVLSLVAMALIWAVCFLFIAIIGEVGGFIADVVREYKMRLG